MKSPVGLVPDAGCGSPRRDSRELVDVTTPFSGDVNSKPEDAHFLARAAAAAQAPADSWRAVASSPTERPSGSNVPHRASQRQGDTKSPARLVLDVGCGPHCQGARALRGFGSFAVIGVDVDAAAARQARRRLSDSVCDILLADMANLHLVLRPGVFDMLLCFYAMQHARSPTRTIAHLSNLAKHQDGVVAVAALSDRVCEGDARLPIMLRNCYRSFLREDELVNSVVRAGCRVLWTCSRGHAYQAFAEFPCSRLYIIAMRSHSNGVRESGCDPVEEDTVASAYAPPCQTNLLDH